MRAAVDLFYYEGDPQLGLYGAFGCVFFFLCLATWLSTASHIEKKEERGGWKCVCVCVRESRERETDRERDGLLKVD